SLGVAASTMGGSQSATEPKFADLSCIRQSPSGATPRRFPMHRIRISKLLAIAGAAGLLGACRDGGSSGPTAADGIAPPETPLMDLSLDPFTYRARIDPYRILSM